MGALASVSMDGTPYGIRNLCVEIMIVLRKGMMNICPRPNGGFIQMRAREPDGHLVPSPPPPEGIIP